MMDAGLMARSRYPRAERVQCDDQWILNNWHAVTSVEDLKTESAIEFCLLGKLLTARMVSSEDCIVRDAYSQARYVSRIEFGYLWVCLGVPEQPLFEIAEFHEPDRRNLHAISIGLKVSPARAVENFLDMGHFPFVHTDLLGQEPHTEVATYKAVIDEEKDEVIVTECAFYQPKGITSSTGGANVEYVYRVPHPFCAVLYKTNPVYAHRMDVIALFVQPIGEEQIRAHMMLSLIDESNTDEAIRIFQQNILAQDKPILENQVPKKLPLHGSLETPVRADASSMAYRRWLKGKNLRYGVLPVPTP